MARYGKWAERKELFMDSGRMPACVVVPFEGEFNANVPNNIPIRGDNNNYYPGMQTLRKGNRCDHDKNNFKRPHFFRDAKRRPHVLEEAKRRIEASIFDHFRYPAYSGLFYHQHENGQTPNGRHIRSERVEGVHSLVLPTLIQSLDLHRMACGYYDNRNKFHFKNYVYLQKQTDQNTIRIKREMAFLQKRGLIKVNTKKEKNTQGQWRTTNVEIEFTDKIFEILDLMNEFLEGREERSLKFYKRQATLDSNQRKREIYRKRAFNKVVKKGTQGLQRVAHKLTNPYPPKQPSRGLEFKNAYANLIHAGLTPQQAIEAIKKKYSSPPS
jgi:hypothetical protein